MKKPVLLLLSMVIVTAFSTAHAQKASSQSQAGGLPALAEEVAQLRALITALQAQVNGPDNPYVGTYMVSVSEHTIFACNTSIGPIPLPGNPGFVPYLNQQAASSTSSRVALIEAYADGHELVIADHLLSIQEMRLSGRYESEVRQEPGFALTIGADGSLYADFGDGSIVRGQMSEDGSTFVGQAFGLFNQHGCADSFMANVVGVRK